MFLPLSARPRLSAAVCLMVFSAATMALGPSGDLVNAGVVVGADSRWYLLSRRGFSDDPRLDLRIRTAVFEIATPPGQRYRLVASVDAADPARKFLQDAFVDVVPVSCLSVRVGQFVPPSGFEAEQEPYDRKFADPSAVSFWSMPGEPRDIGLRACLEVGRTAVAAAVFNGAGRNVVADNNSWKDASGRLLFRPPGLETLELALRGYYGRLGEEGVVFWNAAAEGRYRAGGSEVAAEVQNAMGRTPKRSFYVQTSHQIRALLEPAVRVEMEDLTAGYFGIGTSLGLCIYPFGPSLKVLLDARYWRWFSPNPAQQSTEQRFTAAIWARL